jgi:hypothetical protein
LAFSLTVQVNHEREKSSLIHYAVQFVLRSCALKQP